MKVSIVVAMTEDFVIGVNNRLPWHLPGDLRNFRRITLGKTVIMGRKTFDSIGRPLPDRKNIVLTNNPDYTADGVTVVHKLDEGLKLAVPRDECFVIGGSAVYKCALPVVERIYLTLIHNPFSGDACFPRIDLKNDFKIVQEGPVEWDETRTVSYSFIVADKK